MSITPAGLAQSTTSNQTVECVLTESSTFIETLTLQSIAAQPGLVELVTHTRFLTAKNPAERRVKAQTCLTRVHLESLQAAIALFLASTAGASGAPSGG
jgi:hypothetical protein